MLFHKNPNKNFGLKFSTLMTFHKLIFLLSPYLLQLMKTKTDLSPLEAATKDISKHIKKGDIIIYESTVYPGCTEEFCVPIIEKYSSFKIIKTFSAVIHQN